MFLREWAWEVSFLRYYVYENVVILCSYLGIELKVENHFFFFRFKVNALLFSCFLCSIENLKPL